VRWRQLCWSHLLRDFEALRGRGGASEEIGAAWLAQAHPMCTWWHRVRDGTLQRSTFRSYMSPLRREVERLLEAGCQCGVPTTEGTCREILKRHEALWTFVQVEGVEPTNNTAEVRFVDQKPALNKVWGIGPERKSSEAREFENLLPVSV
jgi:transposase